MFAQVAGFEPFAERDDPDGQEYEEKVEAEFFVAQGLTPATLEDEEIDVG